MTQQIEKPQDTIAAFIDPFFRIYRKCTEELEAVEHPDVLQKCQLNENRKARDELRAKADRIVQWLQNGGAEQVAKDQAHD